MLDQLATKFVDGKRCVGLNIALGAGGMQMAYVMLEKRGSSIHEVAKAAGITSFEALAKSAIGLRKAPIYVNIEGNGVVYKKSNTTIGAPWQALATSLLPGADPGDFFLQRMPAKAGVWGAMARRALVGRVIAGMENCQLFGYRWFVGPLVLKNLIPLLPSHSGQNATLGRYAIGFAGGDITSLAPADGTSPDGALVLGNTPLAACFHLPYATALAGFIPDSGLGQTTYEAMAQSRQAYAHSRLFMALRQVLLAVFLGFAGAAYSLYGWAYHAHATLAAQYSQQANMLQKLERLEKSIQTKKGLMQTLGGLFDGRYAFFADRLAQSLPEGIRWGHLAINPTIADSEQLQFAANEIALKGQCVDPVALASWRENLAELPWVVGVKGQKYAYDAYAKTGRFELGILIKHQAWQP